MRLRYFKDKKFLTLISLALIAFLSANLNAQSGTTSVGGTVFDGFGKVIFNATITLTNSEKGFSRTATTDENGSFNFPAIQPGVYRLEVEMNGFKKFVNTEVSLFIDTSTKISAVLEVGSVGETVNIQSDTAEALLNTQDATVGNPFNSMQVTQLPNDARNVINLLMLQPGVTRLGYVAGGRSDQANITLDGVDVNDPIRNDIFSPNLRLNSEAIEEFRVTTTNANASQGRSSGAQISLVTKSGTNDLRGALFLTGRRTAWTANDFFNNRAGLERPQLDKNVFGGALGGAIRKNRAFFFYSYEGERATEGKTIVRVVPLPTLGQGIVRFRNTNNQIVSLDCSHITAIFPATNGCNPLALSVFADASARYRANSFEAGDSTSNVPMNTAGFRFNADNKIKDNSHVLRLDFNINTKHQAFFRANYINDFETDAPQFPDTPAPSVWKHPLGFVAGHDWTISKNVFNNFRFGLTRNAFTNFGDSTDNAISFTDVYSPRLPNRRTVSAIDSVVNLTDNVSLVRRNHTFQFGTNIRLFRSRFQSFARAFDSAATTAAAFAGGANTVTNRINIYLQKAFGYQIDDANAVSVQNAMAAVIGRYATYTASFTFARDGSLQPAGTPRKRDFRNQEYDFYAQDFWKIFPHLTLTAGLRYNLSRPIYEANGYEVKPTLSLSEYFARRAAGAAAGVPYNEPIVLDFSGPANGKPPLYRWDKNNFQPRVALAWSPNFGKNRFGWLFGANNEAVVRGGFTVTNDYLSAFIGGQFDNQNSLGFASRAIVQNRYNLTDPNASAPPFTGFNQNVRALQNVALPFGNLTFPRQAALHGFPTAMEIGLDESLSAPINYNWNLTYERALPAGLIISVSYLGRKARNLLQPRDAAAIANFVDAQTGTDWNAAATHLETLRQLRTPVSQISQIPYFANLFPANLIALLNSSLNLNCSAGYNQTQAVYSLVFTGAGGCGQGRDWATVQLNLSRLSSSFPDQHIFYQPQYAAYRAWSSIGKSDYQGLTATVRQRLGARLVLDFNYTFSKSSDDGSGLQSQLLNSASAIINGFRQQDMYAASDFDARHIVNANGIFKLPLGRGKAIFANLNKFADLFFGGWQLAGIFRYNSGLPISAPTDSGRATSASVRSHTTRIADLQTCPTRGGSLFGCNTLKAYRSFRNAYPGETGERNVFRLSSYWAIDAGLGKTFDLPVENRKLQFRWEVFNLTNTQKMGTVGGYMVELDPQNAVQTPANWAHFTAIQGQPRSMQFVLRYSF
jgi:hypothetical protein